MSYQKAGMHPRSGRGQLSERDRRRPPQWVPVENAIRFQRDIKGARLAVFDNLGHDTMEEDPKASAAPVSDFLKPIVPQSKPARDEAPRYGRAPDNQPRTSHSK